MSVQTAVLDVDATQPTAFVSYRRSDSPTAAREVARALKDRFGPEQVFFDVHDLAVGSRWPQELDARVRQADVVIAVIGPRWIGLADERGRRAVLDVEEEDVLRREIETALRNGRRIVPVLVEGATMPDRERLPRAFRPLAALQSATLRHEAWDRDVEALIAAIRRGAAEPRPAEPVVLAAGTSAGTPPENEHFAELVEYIEHEDLLLPVLGSCPYDEPWRAGCGRTPDRVELARALAERFRHPTDPPDLARIAQHVMSTRGAVDLHRALAELLGPDDCEPAPVHRFLARIPGLMRARGREHCQVILTANYDSSLERAFDEAGEPFDLAVFMAGGESSGRFLHIPWWDEDGEGAIAIHVPNEYDRFPIDEYGRVERTVIVKIHGGVLHDAPRDVRRKLKHNFVITEDDYIGYLSRQPVENLIPVQLLDKLRESHFLFLGYGVRDWSLRVFLRRIWDDRSHGWAVESKLDRFDRGFWQKLDVERVDVPLPAYLLELERHLAP